MRGLITAILTLVWLLAACGTGVDSSPTDAPIPSSLADAGDPSDLLECDGPLSPMGTQSDGELGGTAESDPEAAIDAWLAGHGRGVPMDGYRNLGAIGNQHVHVYENVGQVKVVLVVARRSGEDGTAEFVVDQLRACQLSEWGGDVDLGPEIVVWSHDTRDLIIADHAGPEHCRWDSARFLNLERPVREPAAGYVRDPLHVLPANALLGSYAEGVELPADATFRGYRSAKGEELWFVPEDRAAYVVSPDGVERWPRVKQALACM